MGAKMIPIVKKRGRTVLGVRIGLGLSATNQMSVVAAIRCRKVVGVLTAMPSNVADETPYLLK